MNYEDAIGQTIYRGDTVTLPNSSAADGNHCGVVLGACRPRPNKLIARRVDGSKVTVDPSHARVADRSYMEPGMVVASSTDDGGQLGLVMCAATELDLARLPSPAVVARAVSPAEVRRAGGEFCVGDYVVSAAAAGWLGCVVEVCVDVDVVFDDGAKCRVAWGQTAELCPTTATVDKDSSKDKDFYPGQRVGAPPSILKASRWLKGYWKPNHGEGTVSRVETTVVLVYWLASSSCSSGAPANLQSPRDLTFLCPGKLLECSYWGVGDRCFFRGSAPGSASSAGGGDSDRDPRQQLSATHREWRQLWRQRRRPDQRWRPLDDDDDLERRPLAVSSTRTTVDVLWQDGTRQHGVPSTSLVVVSDSELTAGHELFPGQHVVRRMPATTTEPLPEEEQEECVGVVRGYSYTEQTVRVSWGLLDSDEETLSAYHVSKVYNFRTVHFGDVVVRRRQLPTTDSPSTSASTSASADDLSWVGQYVYSECDECDEARYIYVKWGDGNTSKVLFREITIINKRSVDDLRNELGEWVDEDGDMNNAIDEAQQKVDPDDDNMNGEDDDGSGSDESDDSSGSDSDSEDSGITWMTRMNRMGVIVQAVIQLARKVFAQGRIYLKSGFMEAEAPKTELKAATESITASTQVLGADGDVKNTSSAKAGINGASAKAGINGDGGDIDDKMEADTTAGYDRPFHLPQFEIVQQSPSDHHYLDNVKQGTAGGRKWTKRVQKEWKILENNNLPDTIYVRVFEDRMDLMRAVMVGASGTPYHDGLFFFDLQLPPSAYPAEPPLVNYHSFGLDVNPNLYPSGTVCLSLLNTFGGQHEAELWSPEASTILQVVVSIQGLVLTAMPYYNEPVWAPAGTPMSQRSELPCSESAFLQSLQTMLHLLRRPPAGFEEFVRDHFRRRGQHVIRACEAYRDGWLVGTLDEEGNPTEGSKKRPCSTGFRIALLNVRPRLVEAFASIDAQGC